jgi:hypothetical protein
LHNQKFENRFVLFNTLMQAYRRKMKITTTTAIEGLLIIEPRIFPDDRGYFYESYNQQKYAAAGITGNFVQDNQSFSQKGALRGLHGQADPFAQGKLVRVYTRACNGCSGRYPQKLSYFWPACKH